MDLGIASPPVKGVVTDRNFLTKLVCNVLYMHDQMHFSLKYSLFIDFFFCLHLKQR